LKLTVTRSRRGETRVQTSEYVPVGPVRIALRPPPMAPPLPPQTLRFSVGVPEEERIKGRIYDVPSGVMLGLASDEEKDEHPARVPFERIVGGTKQRVVVW
jgi:hypothetical protein